MRCVPRSQWLPAGLVAVAAVLIGCGTGEPGSAGTRQEASEMAQSPTSQPAFALTSTAFQPGQPIPRKHSGEGQDVSPPLAWADVPAGTKQLALICDDPDAPSPRHPRPDPWVHWVIYNIPADRTGLPEAVPAGATVADLEAVQGKNSWPRQQYNGPMPPPGSGRHRYFFRLYALDAALDLPAGLTAKELREKIVGHVLGRAELMGTYER
jgi:Raf kinase inhibitor-like YbhB/YbcL family protein